MTLPVSGPISLNAVNVELGLSGTTLISLGQASVRTLAGVPSGAISLNNLYGKSNRVQVVYNITSNTLGAYNILVSSVPGYVAGLTDVTINISAGIYLAASTNNFPALLVYGGAAGDAVIVNNSGYIIGCGGTGGIGSDGSVSPGTPGNGTAGSTAIDCSIFSGSLVVNNAAGAYIAGGGGGGAGGFYAGGGGGAGGGAGGPVRSWIFAGGDGGALGASGGNGPFTSHPTYVTVYSGGGGGRVIPGSQTFAGGFILSKVGFGGTAGGVGAGNADAGELGGYGGGPSQAGEDMMNGYSAGGGGGWGAVGGSTPAASGGNAGRAILRPSGSYTLNNSGTLYGAVI
jgi:hypothetical protein